MSSGGVNPDSAGGARPTLTHRGGAPPPPDVYKRQELTFSGAQSSISAAFGVAPDYSMTVRTTRYDAAAIYQLGVTVAPLDVYKRQLQYGGFHELDIPYT